jgi:transcriptional regulator with XRE-family HTH domain
VAKRPSQFAADAIRRVRGHRGWTQQQLADELAQLGVEKLGRTAIAKMEAGTREISLDNVFAFAQALGVSPAALLLPRDDEDVEIAPKRVTTAFQAWTWWHGLRPLRGFNHPDGGWFRVHPSEADVRFFFDEVTDREAKAWRQYPGVWKLSRLGMLALHMASWDDDERAASKLRDKLAEMRDVINAEIKGLDRALRKKHESETVEVDLREPEG